MNSIKSKKGIRLSIGIVSGVLLGVLSSNIALWLPIGMAIGAGLEYDAKKIIEYKNH
jgi:hypothetical protein